MRTEVGVRQICEEADKARVSNSRILLAYSVAAVLSAVVVVGNVDVSRASPVERVSYRAAENFVVLSLKNSSTIAARVSQETLSSRYDVVREPVAVTAPVPAMEPVPSREAFDELFALEAACQTRGIGGECPAVLAMLENDGQEWPRFTDVALPALNGRVRATMSGSEELASLTVGVTAPVGGVERTLPTLPIERMRIDSVVAEAFTSQAACETGGLFDECPGFMDLLHRRQKAWPALAAAVSPADVSLTTASISHAIIASASEHVSLVPDTIAPSFDRPAMKAGEVIIGTASTYNPYDKDDNDAGGAETASGELYNPIAWTAAIQIKMRDKFAGVRYGRLYEPSFALVELNGKRAIVKINDVGPLRPGRVIDFSTQVMHYFDPSLQLGVLDGVLVTPLIGSDWTPGPLGTTPVIAVASAGP